MAQRRQPECGRDFLTRRSMLRGSAAFAAVAVASTTAMRRALAASSGTGNQVLVHLFLRGGIDPLSTCVPYGDTALYAARPNLAIAPPGGIAGAIDLDGFFGLNPAASPLAPAFFAGDLAIVHAFGSPDPTRSHFRAFQTMEFGIPNQSLSSVETGWLARHLALVPPASPSPLRCAAMHEVMPLALTGAPRTLPVADPAQIEFPGAKATAAAREAALRAMYHGAAPPLGPAAADTLDTIDLLDASVFAPPQNGASYPDTPLGARLRNAASLIRLDVGVEVIVVEESGYDHHAKQGPKDGELALMLDDLARSIAAFRTDLAQQWGRVTLVAHSEFGRRVAENASGGTDHGHGGIAIVAGGQVNGGRVHGAWPGLAPPNLVDGDLAITTDYRNVLAEILAECFGQTELAAVFPNHAASFPGIVS